MAATEATPGSPHGDAANTARNSASEVVLASHGHAVASAPSR